MIYIFDIDGTLTPHRQPATDEFVEFFTEWQKDKEFYLSTGSDLGKVKEQLPKEIVDSARGIFCCMSNQLHVEGELIYDFEYWPSNKIINALRNTLKESSFPLRCGNHIEQRPGMINFTILGRNANEEQRQIYHEHDKIAKEREKIASKLSQEFHHLDFVIGGKISIDIYPKGRDKRQCIEWIGENEDPTPMLYFGDSVYEGGNDYAAAKEIDKYEESEWHNVSNWRETMELLKSYDLVISKDGVTEQ